MPTYFFKNTQTEKEESHFMKISELDNFKKENPHLSQLITGAPGYADPLRVGVGAKPNNEFRDLLKDIKSKHYGSNINTF